MKIARAAVDFVVHIEVLCCPRGGQPWLCSAAFLVIPASLLTVCCAEPLRRHWYRGGFDTGSGEEKWQGGLGFVLRGIKNIYLTLTHFFFWQKNFNELGSGRFSFWNRSHCFSFSLPIQRWVIVINWFKVAFVPKSSKHCYREYFLVSQKWTSGEPRWPLARRGSGPGGVSSNSWSAGPFAFSPASGTPLLSQVCPFRSKALARLQNILVIPTPAWPHWTDLFLAARVRLPWVSRAFREVHSLSLFRIRILGRAFPQRLREEALAGHPVATGEGCRALCVFDYFQAPIPSARFLPLWQCYSSTRPNALQILDVCFVLFLFRICSFLLMISK